MRKRERDAMRRSDLAETLRLSQRTFGDLAEASNTTGQSMAEFVKAHMAHCAVDDKETK